jgi:hypothetical protein
MSWLTSWLHPERGYKNANDVLTGYYNEGKGFQQPYNQNGQNQINTLQEMIDKLSHPEKLQDEWSKGYKESGAAKDAEALATQHGVNAASSLGLGGSNTALNAIQSGTSQIQNQDKQKYLDDLMNKYITGIQTAQGIYNTGATTAGGMATNANNQGQNSAGLKFGETNAPGQMFGQIGGSAIKLLMDYLTGGMGTGSFGRGAWSTGGS